jgi:hypothetical protein
MLLQVLGLAHRSLAEGRFSLLISPIGTGDPDKPVPMGELSGEARKLTVEFL